MFHSTHPVRFRSWRRLFYLCGCLWYRRLLRAQRQNSLVGITFSASPPSSNQQRSGLHFRRWRLTVHHFRDCGNLVGRREVFADCQPNGLPRPNVGLNRDGNHENYEMKPKRQTAADSKAKTIPGNAELVGGALPSRRHGARGLADEPSALRVNPSESGCSAIHTDGHHATRVLT